jgi:hypothetical protein
VNTTGGPLPQSVTNRLVRSAVSMNGMTRPFGGLGG